MVDGIGLALTSLKSASDLAKSLLELRDATKIGHVTLELQGKIAAAQQLALAAQQEQAALISKIDELKKTIVEFEDWDREKKRYQMESLPPGILMYRLKEGAENGEPPHKICADCYNKGKKSFLHNLGSGNGLTHWKCNSCGFSQQTGHFIEPRINRSSDWMA
jgi:hypothetical protein